MAALRGERGSAQLRSAQPPRLQAEAGLQAEALAASGRRRHAHSCAPDPRHALQIDSTCGSTPPADRLRLQLRAQLQMEAAM